MDEYAVWCHSDGGWATEPRLQVDAESEREALIEELGEEAADDLEVRRYEPEDDDN